MAGVIRVTPEQLSGVSAQLTGGAGSIEATLSQLASQVAPLGSDWPASGRPGSSRCGSSGRPRPGSCTRHSPTSAS